MGRFNIYLKTEQSFPNSLASESITGRSPQMITFSPREVGEMSKKLNKRAAKLARKAEDRVLAIRRVVREYNDSLQLSAGNDQARNHERQLEIERAVSDYNDVHRALTRVRKKIELKVKHPQRRGYQHY